MAKNKNKKNNKNNNKNNNNNKVNKANNNNKVNKVNNNNKVNKVNNNNKANKTNINNKNNKNKNGNAANKNHAVNKNDVVNKTETVVITEVIEKTDNVSNIEVVDKTEVTSETEVVNKTEQANETKNDNKTDANKKEPVKKNNKKLLLIPVVAIILAAIYFAVTEFSKPVLPNNSNNNDPVIVETNNNGTVEPEIKIDVEKYKSIYEENKSINNDYAGQIVFESGLIDEPFVFSKDNADYLRTDFKTGMYSILGTVFMDYESTLDSQNIVLYGHTVYSIYDAGLDENGEKNDNDTLMFSPLKQLIDKEQYEENSTIYLVLKNEIREYKIVSVYNCPLEYYDGYYYTKEDLMYNLAEYDNSYFERYKAAIKENEYYNTRQDITNADKLLTLQTCVENHEDERLIVLCKEVNRLPIK